MNRTLFILSLLIIFCLFSYNIWSQSCTTTANFGFTRCPAPLQHTRENYHDLLDKLDDHAHTGTTDGAQIADSALSSAVTVPKGGTGITSGTSGGVPYFSGSTTIASSGALTANLPVIGGGAGTAPSVGTRSGNTTQYVTTTGTQTSGRCVEIDANGNHIAASDACVSGGGTACLILENTAAADDNMFFGAFNDAVTIATVWCNYRGDPEAAPTTQADFALEDGAGNAMTHTTPTCADASVVATAQNITAAGSLTAREALRFDVSSTPNPETLTYQLCVSYTVD